MAVARRILAGGPISAGDARRRERPRAACSRPRPRRVQHEGGSAGGCDAPARHGGRQHAWGDLLGHARRQRCHRARLLDAAGPPPSRRWRRRWCRRRRSHDARRRRGHGAQNSRRRGRVCAPLLARGRGADSGRPRSPPSSSDLEGNLPRRGQGRSREVSSAALPRHGAVRRQAPELARGRRLRRPDPRRRGDADDTAESATIAASFVQGLPHAWPERHGSAKWRPSGATPHPLT
mmetsp:Transcript_16991/g.59435  ORF Transcript_16991/g.59435 Transcript_16991/m.59435 type:complete len:235 (+) Transcript_16991:341-1045(+)